MTILRDGRVVHSAPAADLTVRDAVRLMVGAAGRPRRPAARPRSRPVAPVRLNGIRRSASGRLRDLSLDLHKGEIVGVAGLEGSGVQDLFDALFGTRPLDGGSLHARRHRLSAALARRRHPRAASLRSRPTGGPKA